MFDCIDGEVEKDSGGGEDDLCNKEQPPTSTDDSQTAGQSQNIEQDHPPVDEKETPLEQPQDTGTVVECNETQEGDKEYQPAEGEGEGRMQRDSNIGSNSNDTEEQAGKEVTIVKDGQGIDQTVEESEKVTSEEKTAGNGEVRERDREKEEYTHDEQKTQDQVEKLADTAKDDEITSVEDESMGVDVKDVHEFEAGEQHTEDMATEEIAKVKGEGLFDGHAPTGRESGMIVLTEPLADILEEDEDREPINREELLAETKVRLIIDLHVITSLKV